ncbi:tetratricopeptide repeat protein [Candidatus Pacearchaeota archaeon]|nr:tetratricopeptide repeat protein [Candidatus Pacearchaeota archaeon]
MNKQVIIFLSIFFLISCEGAKERQAFYLEKAKISMNNKSFKKAAIDLKNVLQIDPKNSEAIYLMGTIFENKGEFEKAYKHYVRAIEYDDGNIDARFRLARIYMLSSQYDKVEKEIEKIESISSGHVYVKSLRVAMQYGNKDYDAAIKIGDTIDDSDKSENVYGMYAASIYKLGAVDKSIAILEKAVDQYADNIMLKSTLASLYEEVGDKEKAVFVYKDIINVDEEKNLQHYVNLSNFFRRNNEIDKADQVYVDLVQTDPENEDYQMTRAYYIGDKYGVKKAIKHMASLIAKYPDHKNYKLSLARLHYKNKDINEAKNIVESVIKESYSDKSVARARNLLAMMALASGDVDVAEKELVLVQEINPNDVEANFLLGKIALSKKNFDEAIKSLRIVVRESPEKDEAYIYLAKALERQGSSGLARDVLAEGFRSSPKNLLLATSFIKILISNGENEYALNLIKSPLLNDIDSYDVLKLKAEVYFVNKKYKESLELGRIILSNYSKKEGGYVLTANSYGKLNQLDKAAQVLRQGLDLLNTPKLLIGYANAEKGLGHIEPLISFLESYQEYKPVVFSLLAELYSLTDKFKKAEYYYNKSISVNPKWDMPYISLAGLYKSRGEDKRAIEVLTKGLKSTDNAQKIKLVLAGTYLGMGDIDQSIEIYEQVLLSNPDNAVAINNLSLILVDKFDDKSKQERAFNLVKDLEKHSSPMIVDTVGWVYAKSGRYDEAINLLSQLNSKFSDVPVFKYHLAMSYYYKSDFTSAYKVVQGISAQSIEKELWTEDVNKIIDAFDESKKAGLQ